MNFHKNAITSKNKFRIFDKELQVLETSNLASFTLQHYLNVSLPFFLFFIMLANFVQIWQVGQKIAAIEKNGRLEFFMVVVDERVHR